jgi:hypothetical protein
MSKNAKLIAGILSHLSLRQAAYHSAYHSPKVGFYYFEAWNLTYQTLDKVIRRAIMCRLTLDDFAKNAAALEDQDVR